MRSRRAVASVVGMVFAIIALTTTITYISYSMGILNNYNQSVLVKNQQLTDVDKEKFQISSVTVPNGKLNITIADTGSLPIQFTKVWIQNTSATDQVYSYIPTHNFVSPGGILTNIGQSMTPINAVDSYNIKLVTSRGNTQQFTLNSGNASPLNLQFMAIPPTVPSGFKSQMVLIVTNNSTSTLFNVTPMDPYLVSHNATTCTIGADSTTKIATLPQGGTAVFSWPVNATGSTNTNCVYQTSLQNGYPGQSVQATVTVAPVSVSTSSITSAFSVLAGVLTINYTTFHWTQGGEWNSGWYVPGNENTAYSIKITNNNSTGDFYISKQTFFWFETVRNGNPASTNFAYVVNSVNLSGSPFFEPYQCSGGNDNCVMVPHGGGTVTLYFAAQSPTPSTSTMTLPCGGGYGSPTNYDAFLLMYGKFATSQNAAGTPYAQNIPYVAVLATC